jgi:hypothetical protein
MNPVDLALDSTGIWPHGIHADPQGIIRVTDAVSARRTPKGARPSGGQIQPGR